jgi:2-(1,2-epoxy-1,2-dihydrophenyl)acetyl-CoA isomerase
VGRLVPAAELADAAATVARRLACGPTLAYAAAKQALARAWGRPLADVLAGEQEDQQRLGLTEDHRDAVAAFLSKQRPVFRGR